MGSSCCVTGCYNRSENGHKFHRLPKGPKNKTRRKLWIQNIGRARLPFSARICQDHFTDDQYELRGDKKQLKSNAVPTIFSHHKTIKSRSPSGQEATVSIKHESSNLPKGATTGENLKKNSKTKIEVRKSRKDNSD